MPRGTWGGALDPHIFKVNIRFYMGASKCQTGFKLRDVGVNDNSAQDVADQVDTVLTTAFRGILGTNDGVEGIDVTVLGSEEGGWHPVTTQTGTHTFTAGEEEPNYMAACVQLKSEIRKRYGQGRFFLPICSEDSVSGNILSTGGITRVQSIIDPITSNFTGDPVTHDLILVNAHPLLPARGAVGTPGYRPEIPASWYDVVSLRMNNLVTMLRSRKAGVGS